MGFAVPAGFEPLPARGGFEEVIGPIHVKQVDGAYVCGVAAEPRHANRRGVIHGGMLISLADHTLGMIVSHALERQPCATISLNTDFLSSARAGDWIECRGRITRATRSLVFITGELRVGDRLIATATGIWKKLAAPGG